MTEIIKLTLPPPPSANRYWRNFRGRTVISAEAKAYKDFVGLFCRMNGVEPITGEVGTSFDVYRPRKIGDLSNYRKVLEDALNGFAYLDDKQIVEIHDRRFDDKDNPRVEICVWPIEEN